MNVILIHGMGRSRLSLLPLAARLNRTGHSTTIIGYSATLSSFEANAQMILEKIRTATNGAPYSIVTHSLGGILTRSISPDLPDGFQRFVMLGPPNHAVVMAKKMKRNPAYQFLTGSSGQNLGDEEFYATLPIPDVPTLVIAGTFGRYDPWSPFGGPNDGIVSVEEAALPTAELATVRCAHSWLMNDPLAQIATVEFLGRSAD